MGVFFRLSVCISTILNSAEVQNIALTVSFTQMPDVIFNSITSTIGK